MPGSKCAYLETALQQHVLGNQTYTAPSDIFVALSTAVFDPTATSVPSEVVGTGYGRIILSNDTTNFPPPSGVDPSILSIGVDVNFGIAGSDWGTIYSAYLTDGIIGGNLLYGSDAVTPIPVPSGAGFVIAALSWIFQEF